MLMACSEVFEGCVLQEGTYRKEIFILKENYCVTLFNCVLDEVMMIRVYSWVLSQIDIIKANSLIKTIEISLGYYDFLW